MNTYSDPYSNEYKYHGTVFHIQSSSNGYWVRISYQPTTINQTAPSSSQKYETRHYVFGNQAIRYARGWVDCMLCHQSINQISNDNRDTELLDQLENMGSIGISQDELESAYWEGWHTKDRELNNL